LFGDLVLYRKTNNSKYEMDVSLAQLMRIESMEDVMFISFQEDWEGNVVDR